MLDHDKPSGGTEATDQVELVDLVLLLDTLSVTRDLGLWNDLMDPLPLLLSEATSELAEHLGYVL